MKLAGVFESDPAEVVVGKLRATAAGLLAETGADADAVGGHLGVLVGVDAGAEAADREALFYSIREFLEAVAREQPTILIFEDVHWADPNLLDLVIALASGVGSLPILLSDAGPPAAARRARRLGDRGHRLHRADTRPARRARRAGADGAAARRRRPGRGRDPDRGGEPALHRAARSERRRAGAGNAPDERPRDRRRTARRAAACGACAPPGCRRRRARCSGSTRCEP